MYAIYLYLCIYIYNLLFLYMMCVCVRVCMCMYTLHSLFSLSLLLSLSPTLLLSLSLSPTPSFFLSLFYPFQFLSYCLKQRETIKRNFTYYITWYINKSYHPKNFRLNMGKDYALKIYLTNKQIIPVNILIIK